MLSLAVDDSGLYLATAGHSLPSIFRSLLFSPLTALICGSCLLSHHPPPCTRHRPPDERVGRAHLPPPALLRHAPSLHNLGHQPAWPARLRVWKVRLPTLQRLVTVPLSTRVAAAVAVVAQFLNSHVEVWKDSLSTKQKEPYLSHHFAGAAAATAACFRIIW